MRDYQRLTHTTWDCKYHVVFIPKKRKKMIFGAIRRHLGKVLHEFGEAKGVPNIGRALNARSHTYVYKVYRRNIRYRM